MAYVSFLFFCQIKNKGPAVIGDATLSVSWPLRTEEDEYLLYLAELRITGDGECYVDPNDLNPDSLQVINVNYIIELGG